MTKQQNVILLERNILLQKTDDTAKQNEQRKEAVG